MRYRLCALILVCVLVGARATADTPIPLVVGGSLSTLGPGLSLTAGIEPNFLTAELDAAFIAYSHSISSDGATYSGTHHLVSVGVLGNVYPFGNPFHVSAGAYYLDQHQPIDLHLEGGDYHINGQTYTPA